MKWFADFKNHICYLMKLGISEKGDRLQGIHTAAIGRLLRFINCMNEIEACLNENYDTWKIFMERLERSMDSTVISHSQSYGQWKVAGGHSESLDFTEYELVELRTILSLNEFNDIVLFCRIYWNCLQYVKKLFEAFVHECKCRLDNGYTKCSPNQYLFMSMAQASCESEFISFLPK